MRYIRTKDGIYEPTKWQCDLSNEMILVKADNKFGNDKVFARDIIKQADTIEELYDELVVKNWTKNQLPFVVKKQGNVLRTLYEDKVEEYYLLDLLRLGVKIYGAIWAIDSNGVPTLKPVAKMNDKGELGLL